MVLMWLTDNINFMLAQAIDGLVVNHKEHSERRNLKTLSKSFLSEDHV